MNDNNQFNDLPEQVSNRARELHDVGLSPKRSISLAVNQLEYQAEWTIDEIAEMMGVETNTIRSNHSKAKNEIENAARLLVLGAGGAATILAEYQPGRSYHPFHKYYIISDFVGSDEYDSARRGESAVMVAEICGGSSGHPNGNLKATTTSFSSLDQLADKKYRQAEFNNSGDAVKWYSLLVDAGVDKETLKKPGEKLPASHPDSADHLNYQLRSIERPEQR